MKLTTERRYVDEGIPNLLKITAKTSQNRKKQKNLYKKIKLENSTTIMKATMTS